jgi:hypothetical protein
MEEIINSNYICKVCGSDINIDAKKCEECGALAAGNIVPAPELKKWSYPQVKWFDTPTVVTILVVFCWPVGLYQMWENKVYSLKARIIISAFWGTLTLVNIILNIVLK